LLSSNYDAIINCAAIAPLPQCELNHFECIANNVLTASVITSIAQLTSCPEIIHFSSGAIFVGSTIFPTPEDSVIDTSLVYPSSKYMSEIYLKAYARSYNLNIYSLRLFNLYGPRQDYFRSQPPLIGYLLSCIFKNTAPTLFSDGTQSRDYIFIDDLIRLIVKLLECPLTPGQTSLNVGPGESVSVNEIIEILSEISDAAIKPIRLPADKYWDRYESLFKQPYALSKDI